MSFWEVLFDFDDCTCLAKQPKDTNVYDIRCANGDYAYFSINPLHPLEDLIPTENWHRRHTPRRADYNVVKFRNILVEMDKMSLEEQTDHIIRIGMPVSTVVFSGSKSYHFIISLSTPLANRSEYDELVRRVYKVVGNKKLDRTCKNPSRLSRVPGHLRQDTGKMQDLKMVRGRIPNEELENWLVANGAPKIEMVWEDIDKRGPPKSFSSLSPATQNFLMMGKDTAAGEWNIKLFKAAADLCRNGYDLDEGTAELMQVTGTLDRNDVKTITSAYRNEENKCENNIPQKA